jgi:hypothetical protein
LAKNHPVPGVTVPLAGRPMPPATREAVLAAAAAVGVRPLLPLPCPRCLHLMFGPACRHCGAA